jgi:hypothetical protein
MPTTLVPIFKSKIAGYLSYPLRSSDIARHIAVHAKQYPFEFCFFSNHAPKQNHKDSLPYLVCTLQFRFRLMVDKLVGEPAWELTVRPVLRRHRKFASDFFVNEGFLKFQRWLTAPRTPLWFSTGHLLEIKYIPETESFISTELK